MNHAEIAKSLHWLEKKVLLAWQDEKSLNADLLQAELGLNVGQANQVFSWLGAKGLAAEASRDEWTEYELTEKGQHCAHVGGTAETLLLGMLCNPEYTAMELAAIEKELALDHKDIGSAFGALAKDGIAKMDEAKRVVANPKEILSLDSLAQSGEFDKLPAYLVTLLLIARCISPNATQLSKAVAQQVVLSVLKKNSLHTFAAVHAATPATARENTSQLLTEASLEIWEKSVLDKIAKKRGAGDAIFRAVIRNRVHYTVTADGRAVRGVLALSATDGPELEKVSPKMLATSAWKTGSFRPYNIALPAKKLIPGRRNAYAEFLDSVKDKLVSMGFEEFDGSLVETEFWNSDALFMPQFHAARNIHDIYCVAHPSHAASIESPWLENVAKAHEDGGDSGSRGWQYSFDRDFTRRLILRSQGTVLSARKLPTAAVPGKYFGIARCFRFDKVDATHLSDFYQTEGIVLGEEVNLRTLLGFLEVFAREVAGAKEVKYVPGYFPFTEPSVEVHVKHPELGWFELGGSGIFRPEVTRPLGVDVPVLAWGLGIDRMALLALGINDLRELFSPDIDAVRMRRASRARTSDAGS